MITAEHLIVIKLDSAEDAYCFFSWTILINIDRIRGRNTNFIDSFVWKFSKVL